jgi:hypothetical protein
MRASSGVAFTMNIDHLSRLMNFTESDLPDLDEVVLGALSYLEALDLPAVPVDRHTHPLVVGSGNAYQTGRILFRNVDATFVEEGNFEAVMEHCFHDAVYIVSASGSKHALTLAERAVHAGVPVYLITNMSDSPAGMLLGEEHTYVFPHIREPYTYNTSTYVSMLYGGTGVSPRRVRTYLETVVEPLLTHLGEYDAFLMILPPEFADVRKMYEVKFDELFGPHILGRAVTTEELKHAKTVVTSEKQCFISFGETTEYGNPGRRITIPLMDDAIHAEVVALGYYVIGKVQKANPSYYKDNIAAYVKEASAMFGHTIPIIVP